MARKYYVLTATWKADGTREYLFGDYSRAVVEQEKIDQRESNSGADYKAYKVEVLPSARKAVLDQFIAALNAMPTVKQVDAAIEAINATTRK